MLLALLLANPRMALAQGDHGCASNGTVAEPDKNTNLVADCEILLELKDALRGSAPLNWSAGLPITDWEGIYVSAVNGPQRVTVILLIDKQLDGTVSSELGRLTGLLTLSLRGNELAGSIPAELGNLSNLHHLGLSQNKLSGTIPATLGNLSNLDTLYLTHNQLGGTIPATLGNLSNLERLYLRSNQLSGTIPATLGKLSNLEELYLEFNKLRGSIPEELGNLTKLRYLNLHFNQLSGPIPATLGNLSNLEELYLEFNKLRGSIPEELGNLTKLRYLNLRFNKLSGTVPNTLGNLTKLQSLRLSHNELNGSIPATLGNLVNVRGIYLQHNHLSGEIPTALWHLSDLETLVLNNNSLSGYIPAALSIPENLRIVSLHSNKFCGLIPPVLLVLQNLYAVRQRGSEFTLGRDEFACIRNQAVPPPFNNPGLIADSETLLGLKDTLRGTASLNWNAETPIWLWEGVAVAAADGVERVVALSLWEKDLNGSIPPELANLLTLRKLQLDGNHLTGSIPDTLGNLSQLQHLWLHRNQLTGKIPATLGNLAKLESLDLSTNQLSGTIPESIRGLAKLRELQLHGNRFGERESEPDDGRCSTGQAITNPETKPGLVADCETLLGLRESLSASDLLDWSVESSIYAWEGVRIDREEGKPRVISLLLPNKQFSGNIPPAISNLTSLRALNLSQNDFIGSIPPELASLTNLKVLDLAQNQLTGSIPDDLGNLGKLETLDLATNQLQGSIPSRLAELANLKYLFLQGNQLTGPIPPEVAGLSSLLWLRLDDNELTGTIPAELIERNRLNELGLHGNQFSTGTAVTATVFSLIDDRLLIQRHDEPDAYLELGIGWIASDGSEQVVVSFLRDEQLGSVYIIVRHEGDGRIVRRWVPPDSDLIANIPWDTVIRDFSVPTAVVVAVPLDHRFPEPNQLVRYFAKEDDPIFAYDAELQQWRRVPDEAAFQALGFYKCDMTMADVGFFEQIEIGPAYPVSETPARKRLSPLPDGVERNSLSNEIEAVQAGAAATICSQSAMSARPSAASGVGATPC